MAESLLATKSKRTTALPKRAGGFEIGSQATTAVVICMAWACRTQDDAPNTASQCLERVIEAYCESQLLRQAAHVLGDGHSGQENKCKSPQCLSTWCRPRKQNSLSFFISLTEQLGTEEEKAIYSPLFP